ncbi:hypothetical protein SAMN05421693_10290 [Ectothiorhodospira magna]|uniref:YecA family protein n=1 Tax=Ectothiorhodospira magna TaxID=867345 RepID=A0A1H8ZD84_9GAMM|nr:UPF0149 family protein [Ectothiorhodospira magna]SEP62359.1 hypothetical protein SAMN05421693_10290 [Ectothiorhodospira magna]
MSDYQVLQDILHEAGVVADAAEVHGILCGQLSANLGSGEMQWLQEVFPGPDGPPAEGEARRLLAELFAQTRTQLADALLGFQMLLPDEDDALSIRVDALGQWCQGFLHGLTVVGITDPTQLPADSAEILKDLGEIAGAGFQVDDDEASETAYVEILEYVRVGVLLVSEELQPLKGPSRLH